MRKKSAFLERLTARAAAAFEAGSSFGASDDQESKSQNSAQYVPATTEVPLLQEQNIDFLEASTPKKVVSNTQQHGSLPYLDDRTGIESEIIITSSDTKQLIKANAHNKSKERFKDIEKVTSVAEEIEHVVETSGSKNTVECVHSLDDKERISCAKLGDEQNTDLIDPIESHIKQTKPVYSILTPEADEERICASLGFVAKILFAHLIAMEKNVLNMKRLSLYNQNNMLISYASIRTAWGRLKELGIISHSARHDIGKEKGVLFQLNGQYTFAFQKLYAHMLVDVQAVQGTEQGTELHTQRGTEHAREGQVEDSIKPKTKLEVHPEYNFWREYGLTQTQCGRWKEEFGLDELLLDNYLRWCAHDIGQGERKDKSGKNISNPANWFYSIMKKAGSYPKPEGYQSHEEKTFIARENALKDQAALQERQNALRAQEEKQEAEALFTAFLEEGEESPYFNDLCQKISPFLYENRHIRRRLFENALRIEYFKFLGITISI